MRRSRTVRLTLLAASAVALQACGDDVDSTDYVVTDVASCVERYGSSAQAECESAFQEVRREHLASAPRYATVEECREATGSECETTPANRPSDKALLGTSGMSTVAVPLLAGMLVGRLMDNGMGRVTAPVYSGLPPGACPPPGQQPQPAGCTPRSSSSSSGGARYYYSGTRYAGSTTGSVARGSSAAFTASPDMARSISTGTGTAIGRSGMTVARGGFGASARRYSSTSSS